MATHLLYVFVSLVPWISANHVLQYALTALRNLMDYDYGWATIEASFIGQVRPHDIVVNLSAINNNCSKLCRILNNDNTPINVCRPATSILKKLVEADPRSAPGPLAASSSRSQPAPPIGSVWRYGFDVVWLEVRETPGLLDVVVQRLGNAESGMALSRYASVTSTRYKISD